ncbi:MAG: hypothetical protein WB424_16470 [Terracidiphilus sp.]
MADNTDKTILTVTIAAIAVLIAYKWFSKPTKASGGSSPFVGGGAGNTYGPTASPSGSGGGPSIAGKVDFTGGGKGKGESAIDQSTPWENLTSSDWKKLDADWYGSPVKADELDQSSPTAISAGQAGSDQEITNPLSAPDAYDLAYSNYLNSQTPQGTVVDNAPLPDNSGDWELPTTYGQPASQLDYQPLDGDMDSFLPSTNNTDGFTDGNTSLYDSGATTMSGGGLIPVVDFNDASYLGWLNPITLDNIGSVLTNPDEAPYGFDSGSSDDNSVAGAFITANNDGSQDDYSAANSASDYDVGEGEPNEVTLEDPTTNADDDGE